ncbi:MAG: L-2-hydroxyglutarate oxidase [Bacteriovoracia bacterium]
MAVIGGGIIGLATAYRLQRRDPATFVRVLEKEPQVGQHQTGHNSGVLHAGLSYVPGSLKARLAVNGVRQMVEFCRENSIPHEICGKLMVATTSEELARLPATMERGQQNGLRGLRLLQAEEIGEIEPHARGLGALHVPEEGIVDYREVASRLAQKIGEAGGEVIVGAEARGFHRERPGAGHGHVVATTCGDFRASHLINCAGLQCDRVARSAGLEPAVRIVPFRGDYFRVKESRKHLVRHLLYPLPDPKFPFLGVHFTRRIDGSLDAGPNAILSLAREGYGKRDFNLADFGEAVFFSGLYRFASRHRAMIASELKQSLSRSAFCRALQRLVPEIQPEDLEAGHSGIRAQAMDGSGQLIQDFRIERAERALHLLNAPSPGATASLAIADYLIDQLGTT